MNSHIKTTANANINESNSNINSNTRGSISTKESYSASADSNTNTKSTTNASITKADSVNANIATHKNHKDSWREIVDIIQALGEPIAAHIRHAYLLPSNTDTLNIAYDESHKFIFEHMSDSDNRKLIEETLRKNYDSRVKVEFILNIDKSRKDDTIADIERKKVTELRLQTLDKVKNDPLVKAIIENLSATLISVEPIVKKKTTE